MVEQVTAYLKSLLGMELKATPYEKENAFSYLLRNLYEFHLCSANGIGFVLMCDRKRGELTPGSIAKHGEQVRNLSGLPVVFATDDMAAYNRERLLKKNMPFVIPKRQMYLPFTGIALSDGGAKLPKEFSALGNLAQQIILARLNKNFTEPLSIGQAGELFPYSRISVIRAFDELEYFHLAERNPKTKYLVFPHNGKKLWEKALPLLRNPCRRIVGLEKIPDGLPVLSAGTCALAERTMLGEGRQTEVATQVGLFNRLGNVSVCPKADAPILLQLWTYPPGAVGGSAVDPFSLYLTLRDDPDERVQLAIDEMMKGIPW